MNEYDPHEKLQNSIVTSAKLVRRIRNRRRWIVSKLTLTADVIGNMTYREFQKYVLLNFQGWVIVEGNSVDPS